MQELTFVGLSEDGSRLLLALADGRRFALPIDERLRAATRGSGRAGQMTIPHETMRPKDVQSRLRGGATAEEVAEQAGWPLERVESFAVPVLQERSFVAQQAQASLIRYQDGELPLQEVVAHRLAERGIDISDFRWDAWRGDDGRWTVLLAYPAGRGDQVATWLFDTESRTLQPVDDEAKWLSEYHAEPAPTAPPVLAEPDEPGARIVNLPPKRNDPEVSRHPALRRQAEDAVAQQRHAQDPAEPPAPAAPANPAAQQRSKRASVPSWDEILFGGSGDSEGS